jgi:serine phosphatase RsbU (regulator of sigma subunit)/anti-sigma regulatory factor (Ser/Thr protein kinase)
MMGIVEPVADIAPGLPRQAAPPRVPPARTAQFLDAARISALTADLAAHGAAARDPAAPGGGSAEGAARQAASLIRRTLTTEDGEPAVVLVRFFQTTVWDALTPQLRSYALARMPQGTAASGVRCLALLATLGDRPSWCDRRASREHQALPLSGPDVIRRVPLVLTVLDRLFGGDAAGSGPAPDGPLRDPDTQAVVHLLTEAADSPLVPAQSLVTAHGVRCAIGLGGTLPSGEAFTAVLFSKLDLDDEARGCLDALAQALHSMLAPYAARPLFDPAQPVARVLDHAAPALGPLPGPAAPMTASAAEAAGWSVLPRSPVETALREQRERLEQESRIVETLYSVGQSLARQLDLTRLVHQAIEAATSVIGARFGAFVYTVSGPDGLARTRYAVAGLAPEGFGQPAGPGEGALPGPRPADRETVRCDDVTRDPRHAGTAFPGMAAGRPQTRSYLAVPVIAANGDALGAFYFGHPEPGMFCARDEQLAKGIAAQAASAMDNARLYRHERTTAMALQRSLLPVAPPRFGDLEVATAYLPGEQGARVGGDWFDVIALSADRVALVIGDVMGRGIGAAAVMGQLRAAIKAYAVMDLPPAQVLHQVNQLVCELPREQIATCVYAVYDPGDSTLRWGNAGHLPPALVSPDGTVTLLEADLGMPLGVEGAIFADQARPLPAAARLLLYTDGLVECRDQPLQDRLTRLRTVLADLCAPGSAVGVRAGCGRLAKAMLTGAEHDDVAVLFVEVRPAPTTQAALRLTPTLEAARAARRFVRANLESWGLGEFADPVHSIVSELVTNAVQHAKTDLDLRLRHRAGTMLVEVADRDGRLVRPTPASAGDEHHRGLMIVSTLAARWGVRPTDTGKIVWAEVPVPAAAPGP